MKTQVQDAKTRYTLEIDEKMEEIRKKHAREIQEANSRIEEESAARLKAEKSKQKISEEVGSFLIFILKICLVAC